MTDIDQLIDLVASDVDERPVSWLSANRMAPLRPVIGDRKTRVRNRFTQEENKFLAENLQYLGDAECARILGRTLASIHVHAVRGGFTHPRHAEGYYSGNVIARILGVDSHAVPCWFDLGFMESEPFPYAPNSQWKRRVKISVFKRWLIRPESWIYFNVNKMTDPHLQRLVRLAQEKWGDEWWDMRKAADYVGSNTGSFQGYLISHHLPAVRAVGKERRRTQRWAYWYVQRSVVMQIEYPHGCGLGTTKVISERAMKFIVMARDEWGKTWQDIRRLMRTEMSGDTIKKKYWEWKARE